MKFRSASSTRVPDPNRPEPGPRELHAIQFIMGLQSQLISHEEALESRIRSQPNGWRNYKLCMRLLGDIVNWILQTLPDKTMKRIIRLLDSGEIVIRPKPLIPVPDMQICDAKDIETLVTTVLESECSLCIKDASEAKKCKLRQAMMGMTPAETVHQYSVCPYRDVVVDHDDKNYFDT